MAANAGSKKRKTLKNSTNGVSRKSAFMNFPPNLTVSDNTRTEGTETANLLLLRRNQQHLVSRLLPCCQEVSLYWHLKLQMQAQRRHDYRSPVPVISGIVDVLQPERRINPSPHVECVVGLDDVLTPVSQPPVAQQEAQATEREILLMVSRNAVRIKYQTGAVEFSMPRLAVDAGAELHCLVHFRIRERFMPALVPSPSAKHAHPVIERLLEIGAESVFDRRLQRMSRDFRLGRYPRKEIVHRLAVTSHVGVIHKTEEADNAFLVSQNNAMQLEFNIFRVRPAHVRIQVDSIRHFRHESLRKPHRPPPVVIFDHGAECEPARVRCVVVGSAVVYRPIHELKAGVRPITVQIEKIGHAQFAKSQFQPPHRKRTEKRKRRARGGRCFAA